MSRTFNFIENLETDEQGNIISKIELILDEEIIHSITGSNQNNDILNLKDAWLSLE